MFKYAPTTDGISSFQNNFISTSVFNKYYAFTQKSSNKVIQFNVEKRLIFSIFLNSSNVKILCVRLCRSRENLDYLEGVPSHYSSIVEKMQIRKWQSKQSLKQRPENSTS